MCTDGVIKDLEIAFSILVLLETLTLYGRDRYWRKIYSLCDRVTGSYSRGIGRTRARVSWAVPCCRCRCKELTFLWLHNRHRPKLYAPFTINASRSNPFTLHLHTYYRHKVKLNQFIRVSSKYGRIIKNAEITVNNSLNSNKILGMIGILKII